MKPNSPQAGERECDLDEGERQRTSLTCVFHVPGPSPVQLFPFMAWGPFVLRC